jgi:protein-disulfide isomerase
MKLPLSVCVASALFIASVWMADSLQASPETSKPDAAAEAKPANPMDEKAPVIAPAEILKVNEKDVVLGKADAPVAIFEYSSLSCPHCAHFHKEVLPTLKKDFIDTGKAKLVMRQFPTNKPALEGALLVRCVEPERGVKFEEVLFELQERWAFTLDSREALKKIALVGGLTEEKFTSCMEDKAAQDALYAELLSARDNLKIEATPTFFIGGETISGAREPEIFAAAIEKALAAAGSKE